jgi:hypothetical protein
MTCYRHHGAVPCTDMDFYRSPPGMHWLRTLISPETKFSRRFDDHLAVTVPAAKLAPQTSWGYGEARHTAPCVS